jgi:hypothetical protein
MKQITTNYQTDGMAAYQKVKLDKGSFGVARMNWVALDRNVKFHLYKLWNRLSSGSYFPDSLYVITYFSD